MSRKTPLQTQELFLGAKLGAVREKAGISLEQAAGDTRIRVQRLREIETDDFSGFVHPTYARLFLIDYAAYLGVPRAEIEPLLPEPTANASGGFDYLDALSGNAAFSASHRAAARAKRRMFLTIGAAVVAAIVLIAGVSIWVTWQKIERIAPRTPAPAETSTTTPATDAPSATPLPPASPDEAAPAPTEPANLMP